MPLFKFTIDSFEITDTRSAHKDTDYVSFTMKIADATPQIRFMPLGDLNNGTFQVGLSYDEINIVPSELVILNYMIFNAGESPAVRVEATLATLGNRLADVPSFNLPPLTSSVEYIATHFQDELADITKSSCDGLVAAEQNTFRYDRLIFETSASSFYQTTSHTGLPSPGGCNKRPSTYVVSWSMQQVVRLPSVYGMDFRTAQTFLQSLGLSAINSGSGELVHSQQPPAGQFVQIHSEITLFTQPNTRPL